MAFWTFQACTVLTVAQHQNQNQNRAICVNRVIEATDRFDTGEDSKQRSVEAAFTGRLIRIMILYIGSTTKKVNQKSLDRFGGAA